MINYNSYNIAFNANPYSRKLKFKKDDFFVKIHGYGRNAAWAGIVKNTADDASNYIRRDWNFENVIKMITIGITKANKELTDAAKRTHTGILRKPREGWQSDSDWRGFELITRYENGRYASYTERLDTTCTKKLNNPFKLIRLSIPVNKPSGEKYILHAEPQYIDNAFELISKLFENYKQNYVIKEASPQDIKKINSIIAKIRWILAHATPWERGSDAISNVFIRAMYKAATIKSYPLSKGVSLDLEAYCTNLSDYQKKFVEYFEKPPIVIE